MTVYAPCPHCGATASKPTPVAGEPNCTESWIIHADRCPGPRSPMTIERSLEDFWAAVDAPDIPDTEPAIEGCGCDRCLNQTGWPMGFPHMVVCRTCGNKRCPHASDHRHACTRSNEWGQMPTPDPANPLGLPYGSKPAKPATNGTTP